MDCPQCGAEVPSDDAFCGKCGYAMRDQGPERLDQSRIRVHEEPDPAPQSGPGRSPPSRQRVRKHTVVGMPSATVAAPPPPTSLSSARSRRGRTPQKTMIGIPRPDLPESVDAVPSAEPIETERSAPPAREGGMSSEPATPSQRTRARVRYDSANEPLPVIERRKKTLRGLAVLVLLAAAWLGYRFLTVHG